MSYCGRRSRSAMVMVERGTFDCLHKLELEQWNAEQGDEMIKSKGKRNPVSYTPHETSNHIQ